MEEEHEMERAEGEGVAEGEDAPASRFKRGDRVRISGVVVDIGPPRDTRPIGVRLDNEQFFSWYGVDEVGLIADPDSRDAEIERLRRELEAQREGASKLQAFKDYVHRRLDELGVPIDPKGPHAAEGCRIGQRLSSVLGKIGRQGDDLDKLRRAARDVACVAQDLLVGERSRIENELDTIRRIAHENFQEAFVAENRERLERGIAPLLAAVKAVWDLIPEDFDPGPDGEGSDTD